MNRPLGEPREDPLPAIRAESDLPAKWNSFIAENRDKCAGAANITVADVNQSNGVIQVIDRVLMPVCDLPVHVLGASTQVH